MGYYSVKCYPATNYSLRCHGEWAQSQLNKQLAAPVFYVSWFHGAVRGRSPRTQSATLKAKIRPPCVLSFSGSGRVLTGLFLPTPPLPLHDKSSAQVQPQVTIYKARDTWGMWTQQSRRPPPQTSLLYTETKTHSRRPVVWLSAMVIVCSHFASLIKPQTNCCFRPVDSFVCWRSRSDRTDIKPKLSCMQNQCGQVKLRLMSPLIWPSCFTSLHFKDRTNGEWVGGGSSWRLMAVSAGCPCLSGLSFAVPASLGYWLDIMDWWGFFCIDR